MRKETDKDYEVKMGRHVFPVRARSDLSPASYCQHRTRYRHQLEPELKAKIVRQAAGPLRYGHADYILIKGSHLNLPGSYYFMCSRCGAVASATLEDATKETLWWSPLEEEIKFVNLTPHVVQLIQPNGTTTFQPEGTPVRITQKLEGSGIVRTRHLCEVENLPAPTPMTYYIVSTLVAERCRNRTDLVSPLADVKNVMGQIHGSTCFVRPARADQ